MEHLQLVPPGTRDAIVWSENLHVVVRDAPTTPNAVRRLLVDVARQPIGMWRPIEAAPPLTWLHTVFEGAANGILTPELLFPDLPLGGVLLSAPSAQHLIALPLYEAVDIKALPTLAKTARYLFLNADQPVSDQLHYYDGTLHAVQVNHGEHTEVYPPTALRDGLKKLYSVELCGAAARV